MSTSAQLPTFRKRVVSPYWESRNPEAILLGLPDLEDGDITVPRNVNIHQSTQHKHLRRLISVPVPLWKAQISQLEIILRFQFSVHHSGRFSSMSFCVITECKIIRSVPTFRNLIQCLSRTVWNFGVFFLSALSDRDVFLNPKTLRMH